MPDSVDAGDAPASGCVYAVHILFDTEIGRMVPLPDGQTHPATTFLMLNEGRLIFDGSLHELLKSENPFVKEFLE